MNFTLQKTPAAFFDLDGTLLRGPSLEWRFLRFLYERGQWNPVSLLPWAGRFLAAVTFGESGGEGERFLRAMYGNKVYLKNIRPAAVEVFRPERTVAEFFPEGLLRIRWHAAQVHRIFLVTGTLSPLVERIADALRVRLQQGAWPSLVGVCATRLEEREGRWTGELLGEAVCGRGKVRAMECLAKEYALDLARSFAYGNNAHDQWMLARVGNPVAVNPSRALRRIAAAAGWPVFSWGTKNTPEHRGAEEWKKMDSAVATRDSLRKGLRRKA